MDNELIFNQVCDIILRNRGKLSKPLTGVTTLRKDLGIDGYDAEEIMVEYFTAFEIDSLQFQFEDYFGPEGSNPFVSIIYLFKKSTLTEISVGHLVDCVMNGKWSPPRNQRIILGK
ncbi:DUF1493 family protein [Dyadobacter endophyticus]|uniref:DUF1493 family protein n=1 Tax=Dyadobacter endophyticus TaxID=1749036 RepID=UPI003CF1CB4B